MTGLLIAALICHALPAAARADVLGIGADGEGEGWQLVLTPYAFLPLSTTGTCTVDGLSADVDLDLRDVFESLKIGWQVYGIDYETDRRDGRFANDVVQTGPYLGLTIRF